VAAERKILAARILQGFCSKSLGPARLQAQLAKASTAYAVLVSPLLLEGSQRDLCVWVVVVDVPESVQLQRTVARDASSEATVRGIMAAQLPRERRLALANQVVNNSGSLADLCAATDVLHQALLALAAAGRAASRES
jgi:dephospho-CoA kinase